LGGVSHCHASHIPSVMNFVYDRWLYLSSGVESTTWVGSVPTTSVRTWVARESLLRLLDDGSSFDLLGLIDLLENGVVGDSALDDHFLFLERNVIGGNALDLLENALDGATATRAAHRDFELVSMLLSHW